MNDKGIFFREYGTGKPVVLLHGIMGCSDYWIPLAKKLSAHFRVIVPDLPNHGKSVFTNDLSFGGTATILQEFLHNTGVVAPCVMAHSYGAKVAFSMAGNGMDFGKIVSVDMLPNSTFAEPIITRIADFVRLPLPPMVSFEEARRFVENHGFDGRFADFLVKGMTKENGTLRWKFNASAIGNNTDLLSKGVPLDKTMEMPVLVVKGQNSDYVKKDDFEALTPLFKNISLAEVPKAGHWIHYDRPEVLYNLVSDFFKNG